MKHPVSIHFVKVGPVLVEELPEDFRISSSLMRVEVGQGGKILYCNKPCWFGEGRCIYPKPRGTTLEEVMAAVSRMGEGVTRV